MYTENLRETIERASRYTGVVMVETKGYMRKTAVHRKVVWKDGAPWVRIKGMGFRIKGYDNLNEILGMDAGHTVVFLFRVV